ncbi:MAG: cell division ATP-binding protein FtsE [Clostridia bacterium]|nr:cell division ATP-binding protein FtsE [Clostridia bacterium]
MIEFNNVSKKYDNGTHALKDISLKIEQGEFVFVVGSSGAGKSTFLKLMMREEVPSSGTITVDGVVLNKMKKREIPKFRRKLGIVFQDFRLIPNMSVFDNVAFAMRVIGTKEKKIRRRVPYVLSLMGLNQKARNFPQELSGGEQQRVALARALANNADIIIADEPTGNVDPQMSYEIVDLLMRLNESGTTVIMVTHEHSLVRCFDKRVIILDKGTVVSDGANLIREAATSHINAASEISTEYVVPPEEDYSAYANTSEAEEESAEEEIDFSVIGGEE